MDFYILKKHEKLVAIPADEQNCKEYLDDGYFYVDKVAACNEKSALKRLHGRHNRYLRALWLLVIPVVIYAWRQLSH
ncbi:MULTISPECIES: hypothetical protein [Pseudoalteromonas]|uniref:Uncharacterized protein n=2 Tax=Pseudoalteromonas TaxID=53246 RepID=A0A0F4QGW0_9GAMM|nr:MULTISPECIES: hypothetical protein [Pseudoalteromonas]KJZ06866.1 hypothetical protein TW77_17750 [Pseudoalteromonas rubra]MCF2906971.1 hypothetical protein [Pseudoalteromonas sp. DL2-H2.2]QTL37939.1 hypothetical protein J5X90_19540 [Pseudoalteromonas viridis]RZM84380.1 hypothetical protein C3B51_03940 [Pseudoalteromonas rubra]